MVWLPSSDLGYCVAHSTCIPSKAARICLESAISFWKQSSFFSLSKLIPFEDLTVVIDQRFEIHAVLPAEFHIFAGKLVVDVFESHCP